MRFQVHFIQHLYFPGTEGSLVKSHIVYETVKGIDYPQRSTYADRIRMTRVVAWEPGPEFLSGIGNFPTVVVESNATVHVSPGQGYVLPGTKGESIVRAFRRARLAVGIADQTHEALISALEQQTLVAVALIKHVSVIIDAG